MTGTFLRERRGDLPTVREETPGEGHVKRETEIEVMHLQTTDPSRLADTNIAID